VGLLAHALTVTRTKEWVDVLCFNHLMFLQSLAMSETWLAGRIGTSVDGYMHMISI
jgi:hypothetical protein